MVLKEYATTIIDNYESLVALPSSFKADLILLDYHVGIHTALELKAVIQHHPNLCHCPILLLSGTIEIGQKIEDMKADAFLEKPFSNKVLREVVANLV